MTKDRSERPSIVGPDIPQEPYPLVLDSTVIAGFGRGSSDLGFPTANIPEEAFESVPQVHDTGIYFGWARVYANKDRRRPDCDTCGNDNDQSNRQHRQVDYNYGENLTSEEQQVLPMVMSVGWNPFYNNQKKSAEVYIINKFKGQFYGAHIKLAILGYIRPELNYISKEALIDDISTDVRVALASLDRTGYMKYKDI